MAKKTILSICLIAFGVLGALFVILTYSRTGGDPTMTVLSLAATIACIMAGSVLQFSRLLDRFVNPVLEEIHQDIEDDLQDLRNRRITATIWMVIITGMVALAFAFLILRFHKLEARWGPVPVIIPALIAAGLLVWYISTTRWYKKFQSYTPMWVFLIPALGLLLSTVVGILSTENTGKVSGSQLEPAVESTSNSYSSSESSGFSSDSTSSALDTGFELFSGFGSGDDDSDLIGLVIFLVVLVLILLIGSAFIPHFWFISGSILLCMMVMIAVHDLMIRRSVTKDAVAAGQQTDS